MNTIQKISVISVILVGLILRFHNYAVYPQRGATSDEYSYSFLGVSLLTKGIPISWSSFNAYKNRYDLTINKLYFPIVYPYFDHPPLNGLIVGAWALLNGENTFEKIQLSTIRVMPILFSTISSLLLFLIALKEYGYTTAVWALLIYTTTAIFVMNGRVVLAENLLTPLCLGAIYFYNMFRNKLTTSRIITLGTLAGLAILTKELGITVGLTLLIFFLYDKVKLKQIILLLLTASLFGLIYVLYGIHYDSEVFWKIIGMQSGRNVGPETLYYILTTPIIVNKIFYDGWYFLGFISLVVALVNFKNNKYIVVPSMTYLFLLLFFLTQRGEMGWYIIPLFPFMAISIARLFQIAIEKSHWLLFVSVLFIGQYYMTELFMKNFGLVSLQFRFFLLLLFVPLFIADIIGKNMTFKKVGNVYFYIFILCNAYITYTYIHPA